MLNNDRLAVAAHLHNALRRKLGRITDVEWMARNDAYAREIVRLALAGAGDAELQALAQRLQALLPAAAVATAQPVHQPPPASLPRFVRSLR